MEKNRKKGNDVDQMIQGNKEEADSMLSLWGMKPRRRLKKKPIRK